MGGVLRQACVHHDAFMAAFGANRRTGAVVPRATAPRRPRIPLRRRAPARAASAGIAGTRAQPLPRAPHTPLSRTVSVELQPLQGSGRRTAARRVENLTRAYTNRRRNRMGASFRSAAALRAHRFRSEEHTSELQSPM